MFLNACYRVVTTAAIYTVSPHASCSRNADITQLAEYIHVLHSVDEGKTLQTSSAAEIPKFSEKSQL
jgi:hypothetical protein